MLPGPTLILACPKCSAPHRSGTLESGNTFGAKVWSDGKMIAPMMPEEPAFTKCSACGTFCWVSDMPQIGSYSPWSNSPQREPLSFNVSIDDIWDEEELVARRWAAEFGCSIDGAQRMLQKLPIELAKDVDAATVNKLTAKYEELGLSVARMPCRTSTEPVPQEWATAPDLLSLNEIEIFSALGGGLARTPDEEILLRIAAWHAGNDDYRDGSKAWVPYLERNAAATSNLELLLVLLDKSKASHRLMAGEIARQLGQFDDTLSWLDQDKLEHASFEDEQQKENLLAFMAFIRGLVLQRNSQLVQFDES